MSGQKGERAMAIYFGKPKHWKNYVDNVAKEDFSGITTMINDQLRYIGITNTDLKNVQKSSKYLLPHVDEIVDIFYSEIIANSHLRSIIEKNSTVERLQKTMAEYIRQFIRAEIDETYISSRVKVGAVHSKISLTAGYFLSAHAKIIQLMTSILLENYYGKADEMIEVVLSVQKLGTFDQQLITEVYMEETFKSFLFGTSETLDYTIQLDTPRELMTQAEEM